MTHASPSRTARVRSERGSEPARSGSVMAKQDCMRPDTSGSSHSFFCSGVPYCTQDARVAGVRRHDPEERAGERAPGQDLVHVGQLEESEAHAAILGRQVRRPQARMLHEVLDAREVDRAVPVVAQEVLVRNHLLGDQLGRQRADLVGFVVEARDRGNLHDSVLLTVGSARRMPCTMTRADSPPSPLRGGVPLGRRGPDPVGPTRSPAASADAVPAETPGRDARSRRRPGADRPPQRSPPRA